MPTEATPRSALTHIGAWKLGRTLGRGAYAHVRLATHETGHQAACKILPALHRTPGKQVSWDETVDAIEAHKEVVLLKALSGANVAGIVGLEGVIQQGGWTYVFLTLHPTSASRIPLPWDYDILVRFFRHLLHSVHSLHLLNVSHEDLKRSNVLVDRTGLPFLVDFGFSHFKPIGGFVKSAGGTLDYSSPEKTADEMYDPKANDVWSLGIILLKLLNFPHPYSLSDPDETSTMVKQQIIGHSPYYRFPRKAKQPGGVAELIMGMLERDPKKRWTIPDILRHPFLRTKFPDPKPFTVPPQNLNFMHRIPITVVEDICFLAHLNGEFALCETTRKIEHKLTGKTPCWEKQWAGMLGDWSKRAEMQWEPIPVAITPLRAKSDPTNNRRATKAVTSATITTITNKPQPLREIHLSPNRPMRTPPRNISDTLNRQMDKENMPPKRVRKSRIYGMRTKAESMEIETPATNTSADGHEAKPAVLQMTKNDTNPNPKGNRKNIVITSEVVNIGQKDRQNTAFRKRTKKVQVFHNSDEPQAIEENAYTRSGSVTLHHTEGATGALPVECTGTVDDPMVIDSESTTDHIQAPRTRTRKGHNQGVQRQGSLTAVTRAKAKNARSPTPETQVQDPALTHSVLAASRPGRVPRKPRRPRSPRLPRINGVVVTT
ncbi:hypothetical protein IAU59_001701 [Kwoniella sp. CBS 9459]